VAMAARNSKKMPPFGTTMPQRVMTLVGDDTPGPGTYNWDTGNQKHVAEHRSAFNSETKLRVAEDFTGDPGLYDPYTNSEVAAESSQTFNKTSTPFLATQKRELNVNIFGAETPGPGRYEPKRAESAIASSTNSFMSGTTQRPTSVVKTPGSGTYDPDIGATKPTVKNMGANMQGHFDRFREADSTTEDLGPGAYDNDKAKSLAEDAVAMAARNSKKMPPFGTTSAQRVRPDANTGTPAPGSYYPMEPRESSPARRRSKGRSPSPAKSPTKSPSPGKKRSGKA